ncbi:ssrA-binding protein [Clostridium sp. CAG:762]|jgi:SsrA-binding protein|nr:ssrA-binding protein [Clostridium sp. CAG:762]
MEIINRKAKFDYFTYETYEAGIVLTGTEIKSVRNGKANIKDSYAIIRDDEAYLLNAHISLYKEGSSFNHEEQRTRKLLLHKKEILKIKNKLDIEGYTLIPLKMYFKGEKLKVLLGVCKGKKNYDKKQSLKERDIMREANRNLK